ncbi:PP2C family serine/threonine-protein phosphatase [Marinospirillum insulare]|uniref:Protein phosphatase n=1 Tax=Marinospirillum insulare TaxID=217169 RepID=A0ABQ5ZUS8_9GAMM|nr:PP2C family serine/threonine-protein phosphatase [Marinospirillum insulare]GLR62802.1 protein phosphatase [Marinospirillum insulare]
MRFQVVGASVKGPAHEQDCQPNQDAVGLANNSKGCFAAVADGLGSRKLSHLGSQRAVKIAHNILKNRSIVDASAMPARLSRAWRHSFKNDFNDYETTCLWAKVNASGKGGVGQVGDGLVLLRQSGRFSVLTTQKDSFGNQTTTLSQTESLTSDTADIQLTLPGDGVLLMTDGISDDLIPEQLEAFFDTIYNHQKRCSKRRMKRWLQAELKNWSTPRHGDDKTIASILKMD